MLTCPECCFDALQKIRKDQWKCKECGTSFNFAEMRRCIGALVSCQFQEDFIGELLGDAKLKAFPKLGERAWRWDGKYGILYTLDAGNGWHVIMKGQIRKG
jgi:hypothetical protein